MLVEAGAQTAFSTCERGVRHRRESSEAPSSSKSQDTQYPNLWKRCHCPPSSRASSLKKLAYAPSNCGFWPRREEATSDLSRRVAGRRPETKQHMRTAYQLQ